MLQCLRLADKPINVSNGDKLFAERYIDFIEGIASFYDLGEEEKTQLMNKVLNLAHGFRYGRYSIDIVKHALELANHSLEHYKQSPIRWMEIERKEENNAEELEFRENTDELIDREEEVKLIEKIEEIPLKIIIDTAVEATLACKRIISESGNDDELLYAEILAKIAERNGLGDSADTKLRFAYRG